MAESRESCARFLFQMLDELSISQELIATQGSMQDRLRVITPAGEWMIAIPSENEWRRGQVLMSLRPFILTEQAVGLVVSTSARECFESWILAKGGLQGVRHYYQAAPRFRVTETSEPDRQEAPLLVGRLAWFCAPRGNEEVTWVCLRRLSETLGPNGSWPALSIKQSGIASKLHMANA